MNVGILPQSVVGCWGVGGGGWIVTGVGCGGTYIHEMGHAFGLAHASDAHGECDGGTCDPNWPYAHGGTDVYGWYGQLPDKLISPGTGSWHSHDRMSYGDCSASAPEYDEGGSVYCAGWFSSLNYGRIGQRLWCFDPQWDYWTTVELLVGSFDYIDQGSLVCYGAIGPFAHLLVNPLYDLIGSSPGAGGNQHLLRTATSSADPGEWIGSTSTPAADASSDLVGRLQVPTTTTQRVWLSAMLRGNGDVEIRSLYRLPDDVGPSSLASPSARAAPTPNPGAQGALRDLRATNCTLGCLTYELYSADGQILTALDIRATPIYSHSLVRVWTFHHTLPWHPDAARAVLRRGETVVADWASSATAPRVTLQSPNGGETLAGQDSITVRWEGADADGDELSYWLQYSQDGGQHWRTIQRDLRDTSYELSLRGFAPTSEGRFRVFASDRVSTAIDSSDGDFTIAGTPSRIGALTGTLNGDTLPLSD